MYAEPNAPGTPGTVNRLVKVRCSDEYEDGPRSAAAASAWVLRAAVVSGSRLTSSVSALWLAGDPSHSRATPPVSSGSLLADFLTVA